MDKTVIDYQTLSELIEKVDRIYEFVEWLEKEPFPKENEPLIDDFELSRILHISIKTLYRYRKNGLIPYTLVGRSARYLPSQIYWALKSKIIKCNPKHINDFYQNYINDAK